MSATSEVTAVAAPTRRPIDWAVVRAVMTRDLRAVRRSKSIVVTMLAVPSLLLVVLPLVLGLAARRDSTPELTRLLEQLPGDLAGPILGLPSDEQLLVLVLGYLLAPLFLIVPLMVSSVLAVDAFAGEKERRTLETLLHSPASDRELFVAKVLGAVLPSLAISWIGFVAFAVVANSVGWSIMGRIFVPTPLWLVMLLVMAPAVAMIGMGVMVRVSARARSTQEANQLGGAVILPLIFLAVGQSSGVLLAPVPVALGIGAVLWVIGLVLVARGASRFTRDRLAARS